MLQTLTKEQSIGPKFELGSQISRLLLSHITASNFHKSLSTTITYNSFVCKDKILCSEAFFLNPETRHEFDRQNLGFAGLFLSNSLYQLLSLTATAWVMYCILTGFLAFILRLKAILSRRKYGTYCQLIFSFFFELESALNPISLSKTKIKRLQNELVLQIDILKNRIFVLEQAYHDLTLNVQSNMESQTYEGDEGGY